MKANLLTLVITLTVGVILTASLLMPVLGTYSDDTVTFTNEGTPFAVADEGDHTLIIAQDHTITYDGKDVPYPDVNHSGQVILMYGSDWILRMAQSNPTATASFSLAGPTDVFDYLGDSTTGDLTVTISGTDVSCSLGSTTKTRENMTYTICDKGQYVLSMNPHIVEDTPIIYGLRNNLNEASADVFEIVSGTISTLEATMARAVISTATPSTGSTSSTFEVTTSEVRGELLSLDLVTQTVSFWNSSTGTIAFDCAIVPEIIEYANPDQMKDVAGILSAIPVLVITALVLGATGFIFISRRND